MKAPSIKAVTDAWRVARREKGT